MIGPVTFQIRPPGPPPGPVTIFYNQAAKTPKIAFANAASGTNVNIMWQAGAAPSINVLPAALEPGKTAVFNIDAEWAYVLVDVVNPDEASTIEVSYE